MCNAINSTRNNAIAYFIFQKNAKVEMSKMVINNEKSESTKKPVGVKIHTKTITLEQEFMCAPPQLYRVFTDKEVGVV